MSTDVSFPVLPPGVPSTPVFEALKKLREGNIRYCQQAPTKNSGVHIEAEGTLRRQLSQKGQSPYAVVVSCSDSRVPTERLFDSKPGELFVLRVAGNVCGSPTGGVMGTVEYGVEHLKAKVVLVLGHTQCGAVGAAVDVTKTNSSFQDTLGQNLGAVVKNIYGPANEALQRIPRPATPDAVESAIRLNVLNSMQQLLRFSPVVFNGVREKRIDVHGAIYDIVTGQVRFLGKHPNEKDIMHSVEGPNIRTALNELMPAETALKLLREGNERYLRGDVTFKSIGSKARSALVQDGQRPMAVVLGCADSRVPIEFIFDMNPGDLFVLRNAGSICGDMCGGLIGSAEYGIGHLHAKLFVVLGHTKCGAVSAAMDAYLNGTSSDAPEALETLLEKLRPAVEDAHKQLPHATLQEKVELAIELNIWNTIEFILKRSTLLQKAVADGSMQIHGALYDLEEGSVTFLGMHPCLNELVTREHSRPREMKSGKDSKNVNGRQKLPSSLVPIPGVQKTAYGRKKAWGESSKGKLDNSFGFLMPEFSWYVNTQHGRRHLKDVVLDHRNWQAGITVALVSVPLSLSLGIASGTTPMRGVAAAVFGGLLAGIFGSSNHNIVGPAAALSGMMMSYTVKWTDEIFPWMSLISAAFCAVFALLRLDVYMQIMPTSVFEGFNAGVALIIGLNQINLACGLHPAKKHEELVWNVGESVAELGNTKAPSLVVFLIQTPVLYLLMKKFPKIPWMAVMSLISVPFGWLCDAGHISMGLLTLKSKYGMLSANLVSPLRPIGDLVQGSDIASLIISSGSIAVVSVRETLNSAKFASSQPEKSWDESTELRGLTLGQIACGLTGAMAPTGVFECTSLNILLAATHRFSQVLNGFLVAMIAAATMPLISYLPQATIAALLVVMSIRRTPISYLKWLWGESKGSFFLCIGTALICVGKDPVIGLGVGMVIAALANANHIDKAPGVDIEERQVKSGKEYFVSVVGSLTYLNTQTFIEKVKELPDALEVTLSLQKCQILDHDGITALETVIEKWTMGGEGVARERIKISVPSRLVPAIRKAAWFISAECQGTVLFDEELV